MTKLTITANTTYKLKLVYKDIDGIPIDITGATATITFRKSVYSAEVINTAATIDGITGEILFIITPADTANVLTDTKAEVFVYDALLYLADGSVIKLIEGEATIKQSITRGGV